MELNSYKRLRKKKIKLTFKRNVSETKYKEGHTWEIDENGLIGS